MTDFSNIVFEVCSNPSSDTTSDWTWVDITADVLAEPRPRWNRGIMSNKHDAHVGDPGYLTFSLNNSISNSAGKAGFYSPDSSDCSSDFAAGVKVILAFVYDGVSYFKYYGNILPDGIKVIPGIYGERRTDVTCGDFMWRAQQHELKSLTYETNQNIVDLVMDVNANMVIGPLRGNSSDSHAPGTETFPSIFDITYMRTNAMSEYIKAATSEWGYIYVKGDTTLGEEMAIENKTHRSNEAIKEIDAGLDDSDTVVLMHFNGGDGSTDFHDESGKIWTPYGNTQIDTAQYKFGNASGLFDGAGDYLFAESTDTTDFDFGTTDWTIDFWIRRNGNQDDLDGIISHYSGGGTGWVIMFSGAGNTLGLFSNASGAATTDLTCSTAIADATWTHVAFVRYGNTLTAYLNGVADATADVTGYTYNNSADTRAVIGQLIIGGAGQYFAGWIDELRITKGKARWTSNFTAPTALYGTDVTFYNQILPGMEISHGGTMVNRVLATVYPRSVDAAATSVLCKTERRVKVEAGETITDYRLGYRDPSNKNVRVSGFDMVLADSDGTLDTTDWTAATSDDTDLTVNDATSDYVSSTDITAVLGTESAIFSIYNHHASAPVYMYLQARGRGVYTYDPIRNESNDSDSQDKFGVVPLTLDMKYLTDPRKAQWVSDYILNIDGDPHTSIEACPLWANRDDTNVRYFLQCEPGDRVHVQEDQSKIHGDYFINGYNAEIAEGKYVLWNPVLKRDPEYMTMWRYGESGAINDWYGICYANDVNRFVAVSIDHNVMYSSTDGYTWTDGTPAAAVNWKSVAYSSDLTLFAAVASDSDATSDNCIMTSTDGINWTSRSAPVLNTWRAVCFGGDRFMAVADQGVTSDMIMTTTDGLTWASATAPSVHQWEDLVYSPALGMVVAVARDNTSDNIMSSTDAITWTQRGTPTAAQLFGITWSPSLALFAAVGYGDVYTSPDGINWTARTRPDGYWHSVAWSEEKAIFVAVGGSGTVGTYQDNRLMISADGITWTANTNVKDGNWHHVCWSSELDMFCAVGGYYATNLAYSK